MADERVVLITGAAIGIGHYTAMTFAKQGYWPAVADISSLDGISADLTAMEVPFIGITADVRDEDAVATMVRKVVDRFGRIDVLVNNAGVVPHFAWGIPRWPRIRDMDREFWNKVIDTNLGGTFLCTKHVLPIMEAQHSGHIVNLYGGGGGVGACAYVVSKEAIRTFTRFVAEEERESGVIVVALSPGTAIATPEAPEEARQRMPGPETMQDAAVLAAQVGMDQTGRVLQLQNGALTAVA